MKNPRHHESPARISGSIVAVVLAFSASQSAFAASGTWTGATDNTWQTSSNWDASPFPGDTSGFSSTDIATFAAAGSGTIDLGGTLNIHGIQIGANGGSAGALIIGGAGDALNLTSGGNITMGGGVTANQIIGTAGGSINLSTAVNSTYSINNYGTGSLTIAAPVTSSQTTGNVSVLTLGGAGNGSVTGVLSGTDTAGNAGLGLVKYGSGTWSLSGANTYTGSTEVRGGTLALDYSANNTPIAASTVTLVNGGLQVTGKSSGTTAATIDNLTLGVTGTGQAKTITLDANGGSGVQLTISTLAAAKNGGQSILFDLSSSSGNSITVTGGPGAGGVNIGPISGVLGTGDPNSGGRSPSIIVRDTTGYGFGVLSSGGGTTGTLGRLSSFTTLTDSHAGSSATNFRLNTAGTLTRTADFSFNTLTIDSSAGAIVLDTGSFANATGRAVLATGANDVTINGTGTSSPVTTYNNYLDSSATLTVSRPQGSSGITFNGTGFTNYSGNLNGGAAATTIQGGIVRLSMDRALQSLNQKYIVSGGAVLEIGADLNGATAGDFSSAIGTANGNIRFIGDSGLSAAGTDRVANFGGSSAQITWGSSNFLTDVDGATDGGYTLKLSSARSTAKLTIQNGIALGTNTHRVIDVANGSAATDAVLSGVISGSGATLVKKGTGKLSLDNVNTYSGATVISDGTLALGSSGSLASTTYSIANDATFDVSAKSSYSLAAVAVTIDVGSAASGFFNGPTGELTLGNALTLNFTTSMLTDGQTYNLFDFGSQTGDFSSVALSGSIVGSLELTSADTWTGSFGGHDFTFSESTGTLAIGAIPEPSTWALLFGGASLVLAVCRKRHGRSRSLVK